MAKPYSRVLTLRTLNARMTPWGKIRTFKQLQTNAAFCGVHLERHGHKYESWKEGEDHTIAESTDLEGATADVRDFGGLLAE